MDKKINTLEVMEKILEKQIAIEKALLLQVSLIRKVLIENTAYKLLKISSQNTQKNQKNSDQDFSLLKFIELYYSQSMTNSDSFVPVSAKKLFKIFELIAKENPDLEFPLKNPSDLASCIKKNLGHIREAGFIIERQRETNVNVLQYNFKKQATK